VSVISSGLCLPGASKSGDERKASSKAITPVDRREEIMLVAGPLFCIGSGKQVLVLSVLPWPAGPGRRKWGKETILVLRERSRTAPEGGREGGRESRRERESNLDGAEVRESEVEALADAVGGAVAVKLEHPALLLLLVGRGSGSMRCCRGRVAAESWTGRLLRLLFFLLDWGWDQEVVLRLVMLT